MSFFSTCAGVVQHQRDSESRLSKALPFLPAASIPLAFQDVVDNNHNSQPAWHLKYVRVTWVESTVWPPSTWSVFYPRHTGGAVPLQFLVKTATTVSVVFHSFPDVFFFAVLLRNQGGTRAESRRCHCGHGDPIELPLRFDSGATAIIGSSTAGPVRCHCGAGSATGVAMRQQGGSTTSAWRLDKGGGFRSNSLQFSLLLRTLVLLLRLLLLSLVMPP